MAKFGNSERIKFVEMTAKQTVEAVRVGWPWLAELHADADNLFHRVQQGMLSPSDASRAVRDKIEAAQAAVSASSTGDQEVGS